MGKSIFCCLISAVTLAGVVTPGLLSAQEVTSFARLGLPAVSSPADNPTTPTKVALGRRLFFDTRLSGDGSVSCATCHIPEKAFTDGRVLAQGIRKQPGTRNTPSLVMAAYATSQFWDGRRASLEEQAKEPFINAREHGLPDYESVVRQILQDSKYVSAFKKVFGILPDEIRIDHVQKALASFVRSLVAGDSSFDRYYYAADRQAMLGPARQGFELFRGRARCVTCHTIGTNGAIFTDNQFHNLSVGLEAIAPKLGALTQRVVRASSREIDALITGDSQIAALGRFLVTKKPVDIGRFRTPSLRNVALTAPYMHDGSVATLEQAVELEVYYRTREANRPLILTVEEKTDLVEFLRSLTSGRIPDVR